MNGERFTLDTNILVYSVDRQAGQRRVIAAEIIEKSVLRDCWLTLQAVSEFYAAAQRRRTGAGGPTAAGGNRVDIAATQLADRITICRA